MRPRPHRLSLLMLIVFLALLPLTISYAASALESGVDGSHVMDCQGDDCDMQHAGEDEECCQQQCDSSFGSQICSDQTLTLETPRGDSYVEAGTPETPVPLPDRPLRPPLPSV
ncbi:hypothetical protein [Sedimenticola hydrogenitrophicus]|uniref:hypothetical protein n=1 Tax=Sedimenticola hydrogenitrophicus TaxID=2967975 RepID=UPI0021A7AE71|nr:hypothetical protein [Sedimenticola hydrogenitrophicus]